MQITVTEVGSPEMKKGPKARYETFVLKYTADGKPRERKMMSFDKEVYPVLKAAVPGDVFEIKLEKKGDFWNWVEATPAEASTTSTAKPTGGKGGNWETAEERAQKQVLIVRQNALTNAVSFSSENATVEDVLSVAEQFAHWVIEGEIVSNQSDEPEIS